MSEPILARYQFLPYLRQGAAALLRNPDPLDGSLAARAVLPVTLRLNVGDPVQVDLRLYGPGDVIGLDAHSVVRTEPRSEAKNFLPNYLPAIEFSRPDLPWLFTPAGAGSQERLRPWFCLVVVEQQEGVSLRFGRDQILPILEITGPAQPGGELPPLEESWAWAHVQVSGELGQGQTIEQVLAQEPGRVISRLVCPRRLLPNRAYHACVVPAFKAGLEAGLGLPDSGGALAPAWASGDGAPTAIRLPVYYHWAFSTGSEGDFEALVRLLQPRLMPDTVGSRPMDVSRPGSGIPDLPADADGRVLLLEGALRAPGFQRQSWPNPARAAFESALVQKLNAPETLPVQDEPGPIVAPPLYGRWHAAQKTLQDTGPEWFRQLNLDPRERVAAGFGTLVVQDQQEALMHSAWEQIDEVLEANRLLQRAQYARAISTSILERSLVPLAAAELIQVTRPLHARVRMSPQTLFQVLRESAVPEAAATNSFRRVARPRGPLARRLSQARARGPQPGTLLRRINEGTLAAARPRSRPDGAIAPEDIRVNPVRKGDFTPDKILQAPRRPDYIPTRFPRLPGRLAPLEGTTEEEEVTGEADRLPLPVPVPLPPPLPTRPPAAVIDNPAAARFRSAAQEFQEALTRFAGLPEPEPGPALTLPALRTTLLQRIDPRQTVTARIQARVKVPPAIWKPEDPLEAVMAYPKFDRPMYEALRDIGQELLLPGLELIPPNTVTLLETNAIFIEAYLAGLNHEMARELLWREYPTDQRGTYFRQFWDVRGHVPPPVTPADREKLRDIPEIHRWKRTLGNHMKGGTEVGKLVLLVRGELLRRFPTAVIYACEARFGTAPNGTLTRNRTLTNVELYPLFRGTLDPDITFLGFDLDEEKARGDPDPAKGKPGWFLVLQEQPSEPRFGLDVADKFAAQLPLPTRWDQLSWGHLADDAAAFDALDHIRLANPLPRTQQINQPPNVRWRQNAAHMAFILLQKPVRIAIHADDMLPKAS